MCCGFPKVYLFWLMSVCLCLSYIPKSVFQLNKHHIQSRWQKMVWFRSKWDNHKWLTSESLLILFVQQMYSNVSHRTYISPIIQIQWFSTRFIFSFRLQFGFCFAFKNYSKTLNIKLAVICLNTNTVWISNKVWLNFLDLISRHIVFLSAQV